MKDFMLAQPASNLRNASRIKGPESCLADSMQDTITNLEDQIKNLEVVVRQTTMGRDGEIEIRLLPNEAKRKQLEMRLHGGNIAVRVFSPIK
jgi:hypothetical protein